LVYLSGAVKGFTANLLEEHRHSEMCEARRFSPGGAPRTPTGPPDLHGPWSSQRDAPGKPPASLRSPEAM